MKLQTFALAVSLAFSTSTFAQERLDLNAWNAARPATKVTVSPSKKSGEFVVRAVFTDLNTSNVLARPVLLVAQGKPARIEIGAEPGTMIRISVDIAMDGRTATYLNEVFKSGQLDSSNSTTLSLVGT